MQMIRILLSCLVVSGFVGQAHAAIVLYDQDFESPAAFVNDGGDINIFNSVNTLYGNQPIGFTFAQNFTVETLLVTGNQAFGTGYSDPSGIGGNYALGMLGVGQNDLLGLSFDVGTFDFLNVRLDISSIDLDRFGGPFNPPGDIPVFELTLFDNPSGATGLSGNGTVLDSGSAIGTASDRAVFDWTSALFALDASGSTNGNVTLRIDLAGGQYAAFDNLRIVASNTGGDLAIPEPSAMGLWLVVGGVLGLRKWRRQRAR